MISRSTHDHTVTVTFTLISQRPVSVVGDFNEWDPFAHPLAPSGTGRCCTIELAPGVYRFRYLADGGVFFDDEDADMIADNGIGGTHSVLVIEPDPPERSEPDNDIADGTV